MQQILDHHSKNPGQNAARIPVFIHYVIAIVAALFVDHCTFYFDFLTFLKDFEAQIEENCQMVRDNLRANDQG